MDFTKLEFFQGLRGILEYSNLLEKVELSELNLFIGNCTKHLRKVNNSYFENKQITVYENLSSDGMVKLKKVIFDWLIRKGYKKDLIKFGISEELSIVTYDPYTYKAIRLYDPSYCESSKDTPFASLKFEETNVRVRVNSKMIPFLPLDIIKKASIKITKEELDVCRQISGYYKSTELSH